jgi:glycosyltransferase involved in cell wall biosynthesis
MRVLWLSNAVFTGEELQTTGTWLGPLAEALLASGDVVLGNISEGKVPGATRRDCGAVTQWVVPRATLSPRDGLPPAYVVAQVLDAIEEFAPDLVHVWGVENYWGLLTARRLVKRRALLEMQGLRGAYAKVYTGGLNPKEQRACIGLKEVIRRTTLSRGQRRFAEWGRFENEMLLAHSHIDTQSEWMEAQVRSANPGCHTYHTDLVLRPQFSCSHPWKDSSSHALLCVAAYPVPYKGIHVALRAAAILKSRFPKVSLRIAGELQRPGIRRDGYARWLDRLASRLNIRENVEWLGPLASDGLIEHMHACGAMIVPSYAENCCTAMQEGMMIGIPIVASYAGGLPSLAEDGESALFFPTGDDVACAWMTARLLVDHRLAGSISRNARTLSLARNNPARVAERQVQIYREVLLGRSRENVR